MRALSLMIATLMTVAIAGCSTPPPPEFSKTDTDNINKLIQDFVANYNSKEAAKLAVLFTPAGTVMPPNAPSARGTDNVRDYYAFRFSQGASGLELDAQDIAGHGPLAVASGDYRLNMAPEGGPVRRDRGKFIFVLRESADKWQLDRLMFSSDFTELH
ncbi:MAG: DUF4440 domain-containing protein [Acidobacteria bacterium]|nr:DUF4440 domain-containing protein [Acidobacteriota bacterium]